MNIAAEKAIIMQRFSEIDDIALIRAIRQLLDFGITKETNEELLDASIRRGLKQSDEGQVRPHSEVWAEVRNNYKA